MLKVLALLALGASVADAIADATLCGTFKVNGVMLAAVHSSTFTLTHDTLTSTEELMVIKVVIPSTAKNPRSDPLTYVLTKCASTTAAKAAYPPSATVRVFSVPLTTVTASDTIQLAYLEELGVLETLVGYIGSSYVYSPFKIRQITTGNVGGPIADFSGADYGPYNSAVLTGTNAGAYMFNSYDFRTSDIEIDTGVLSASASDFAKVVVIDEVNEATPLGRAEWIKVVFLFTSEDAKQLEKYDDIVAAYAFAKAAAVTALANAGGVKPTIWNAILYYNAWYATKSNTFTGQLLEDAGAINALPADYTLPDYYANPEGNLAGAKKYGAAADFWFGASKDYGSLGATVVDIPYTADFRAVSCHNVWNSDKRSNTDTGGSDYYEGAVLKPNEVLADLVTIFYGGNSPTKYYEEIKPSGYAYSCPSRISPPPSPPSPPPPSPSPPPPSPSPTKGPIKDEPRIEVAALVTVGGSVDDWTVASGRRSSFEGVCDEVLGAPCYTTNVTAGSVVIAFTVVQYVKDYKDAVSVTNKLADPAVLAAFSAKVKEATGFAVESSVQVVKVSPNGTTLLTGVALGLTIAVIVLGALLIGLAVYFTVRRVRARPPGQKADTSSLGKVVVQARTTPAPCRSSPGQKVSVLA